MIAAPMPPPMPRLPCTGEKVCWRNLNDARAQCWEAVFGPGPFEVVRVVDKTGYGLPAGFIVETNLGNWEINEVWLKLAEDQSSSD